MNDVGMRVHVAGSVDEAEQAVTEALQQVGFGVLTRIDVAETLKKKIGVDHPPYRILGACNPRLAHRAISLAPEVGLLLPCNVLIRTDEEGRTEVSIIDPDAMLGVVRHPGLNELAAEARQLFEQVLQTIAG
ncbi:MAG: DUF302 domain-containing protein [Zetaproteobacteria bacterium]|nr:MAG: DUF302 domain-containing protein [Zetaproteobacteria bacterium]